MIDRYTKALLTVIALALVALAAQNGIHLATAQGLACGAENSPCFIETGVGANVAIRVVSGM